MKTHAPKMSTRGKIRDGKILSNGTRKQTLPFYVAPSKRYYYWTPKALAASRRRGIGKIPIRTRRQQNASEGTSVG